MFNLATYGKSQTHYAKGMRPPRRATTVCKHTVSGSISLPSRGSFHLSLTVLVHYRSPEVLSLGGWSPQIPTRFHVSRRTQELIKSRTLFVYRAFTFYDQLFQTVRLNVRFVTFLKTWRFLMISPTTPHNHKTPVR